MRWRVALVSGVLAVTAVVGVPLARRAGPVAQRPPADRRRPARRGDRPARAARRAPPASRIQRALLVRSTARLMIGENAAGRRTSSARSQLDPTQRAGLAQPGRSARSPPSATTRRWRRWSRRAARTRRGRQRDQHRRRAAPPGQAAAGERALRALPRQHSPNSADGLLPGGHQLRAGRLPRPRGAAPARGRSRSTSARACAPAPTPTSPSSRTPRRSRSCCSPIPTRRPPDALRAAQLYAVPYDGAGKLLNAVIAALQALKRAVRSAGRGDARVGAHLGRVPDQALGGRRRQGPGGAHRPQRAHPGGGVEAAHRPPVPRDPASAWPI